jgi:hypothetical protein
VASFPNSVLNHVDDCCAEKNDDENDEFGFVKRRVLPRHNHHDQHWYAEEDNLLQPEAMPIEPAQLTPHNHPREESVRNSLHISIVKK